MTAPWHRLAIALVITIGAASAGRSGLPHVQAAPGRSAADALSAILLLDTSASVSRSAMLLDPRFAEIFNAFFRGLKPGDRSAVGVIANRARFTPLTSDTRELTLGVRALLRVVDADRLGPSPVWDAIDEALTMLEAEAGRRAIVVFTDGKASGNLRGSAEVLDHARRLRAAVHPVIEGGGTRLILQPDAALDPADVMRRVAEGSGGRLWLDRPASPRDRNPATWVGQIMAALQAGGEPR